MASTEEYERYVEVSGFGKLLQTVCQRFYKGSKTISRAGRGTEEDLTFSSRDRGKKEYEVEKILDKQERREKPKYLVRWKGYMVEKDT